MAATSASNRSRATGSGALTYGSERLPPLDYAKARTLPVYALALLHAHQLAKARRRSSSCSTISTAL